MRCVDAPGILMNGGDPPIGAYLSEYLPEAHEGQGFVVWCDSAEDALLFKDAEAVWALWQRVPQNRPLREDGEPNRPLTAFSIEVVPVDVR